MGPFLTVGSDELGLKLGGGCREAKEKGKKGENKTDRVLRPTASTNRTEQWFKDRPEDLKKGGWRREREGATL